MLVIFYMRLIGSEFKSRERGEALMSSINATKSHYLRTRTALREPLSERLVARGVRLTPRSRALLEILEEANRHLDAAELLTVAKQRPYIGLWIC